MLCYLAGDRASPHFGLVRADFEGILAARSSAGVAVAVQYDGPEGAVRHVLPRVPDPGMSPVERLGRVNSGSAAALADFLRWGLSVCPAERVALMLGGRDAPAAASAGQAGDAGGAGGADGFTVCRDDSCGGRMDVVDLGTVLREVQAERGLDRELLEILAVDGGPAQFLEVAYQLEGCVRVFLAPQTAMPGSGWNYTSVLRTWVKTVREAKDGAGAPAVARALVPAMAASCRVGELRAPCVVSALDLRGLEDVARAFDTFCIGMIQALGEGLIWETRRLLASLFDAPGLRTGGSTYDGGTLFMLMGAALDAMADESIQGWLGGTFKRATPPSWAAFREAVARRLGQHLAEARDPRRLRILVNVLRGSDAARRARALLRLVRWDVKGRLRWLMPGEPNRARRGAARDAARDSDRRLAEAIEAELGRLPFERRFDFERLKESADTARRLARQARHVALALFGSGVEAEWDERGDAPGDGLRAGMVLAVAATRGALAGWPRWSGVSVYRPPELDARMDAGYRRLAFHQRVHWVALLGAANLIDHHPRALWRLVSSLLATGAAVTRRDLLNRLTGPDSVMWGLRDQFRALAPASTLTLSLEKRRDASPAAVPARPGAARERYLLRLTSATRGAVVTEQLSRVQPRVMDRALGALDALLAADAATPDRVRRLGAIGSLLGEDIFQGLSRILEEERLAALEGDAHAHPHLQLQIARELMRYPWELMQHRGEWLSERFAVGRQVFMETGLARRVARRRQGRVRPLVIGDPVLDDRRAGRPLPGARAEAEQVAGWFQRLREDLGQVIDFDPRRDTRIHGRLTLAEFRELLRTGDYDIIHYAGHGLFRGDDPEASAWLLSDGELWALEIRNTLMEHPAPPWLVYANACQAAMESDRPACVYQGNVFGLASAFINQGVAAYIAPLWPVDDLLAQHIALEFYRHLLRNRATLGEALRRAKTDARRLACPEAPGQDSPGRGAWGGLGWASLVLYGDPTGELFQALAGNGRQRDHERDAPKLTHTAISTPATPPLATAPALPCLHAPDAILSEWVRGPALQPLPIAPRGDLHLAPNDVVLELVEDAGFRRWRRRAGAAIRRSGPGEAASGGEIDGDSLPGSTLGALLRDERLRPRVSGERGLLRVIGRWLVRGFAGGLTGLVREYDREQVAREGLLWISGNDAPSMRPASREALSAGAGGARSGRVLLLIHGTFSNTASPVEGLGPAFLGWARERYGAVLGLDHWTLSKTPLENAAMLAEQLRGLDPRLLGGRRLDVVAHSRGGLVGRAFCELLGHASAVRHLVFVGTPNCGTDLANPRNWGAMADLLVNMTGVDFADLFGRLAALLARLAVSSGQKRIPGLLAQNPRMADVRNSFLNRLQRADADRGGVRYAVVSAEFEPAPLIPNLKGLWQAARDAGVDIALDRFFTEANDLVVNTAHAWCIEQGPGQRARLPSFLKPGRVLVYVPAGSALRLPAGVNRRVALGVHHCNLFVQPPTREGLRQWLGEG
ncbi:MAG: CHAT domain-containing protein [Verrucomicrobia bacterium]|nr:CHAT domain-containing protein [Verrucomicrobiota bacterium]